VIHLDTERLFGICLTYNTRKVDWEHPSICILWQQNVNERVRPNYRSRRTLLILCIE
jgi:hypothetical protein